MLLAVSFMIGCNKPLRMSWVYYDETVCADRWGYSNVNEVQKDNVTAYYKKKGIRIYELEIIIDRDPEGCGDCSCKTGRRIKCKVKKSDVKDLLPEGFYE